MSSKEIKEGDVVLCTVAQIDNANVLVTIDEHSAKGNIIFAEVSPGRIRNIREFVSVGKKIVCKVLRKNADHIELSLRRVTAKERDTIMGYYKKERVLSSMLKPIVQDKLAETMAGIKKEADPADILDKLRDSPQLLKKFLTPAQMEQLKSILVEKKEKEKVVQKKILIRSEAENGIKDIQAVLNTDEADIAYLGSSQFLIRVKGKEYKAANTHLEKVLATLKEKAKAHKIHFEIK